MFVPVSVQVDGVTEASRGFEMLSRQAKDMSGPLGEIGASLMEAVEAQYMSEGAWSGTSWAPLLPAYGEWKDRHVPGAPMLVGLTPDHKGTRQHPTRPQHYHVSGKMLRAVLDPMALHVRPTYALYEPENRIARYHQEGTSKMAARPVIVLTPTLLREWDRIFVRWLNTIGSMVGVS